MIKQEYVEINIGSRNIKYFKNLGYSNVLIGENLKVKIKDLKDGSKVDIIATCDICEIDKTIQYVKYIKSLKNGGYYTCNKCSNHKVKETNLERYGVEHPLQNNDILNKVKETNLERYGVNNVFENEKIKEKIKETNIERYGNISPLKNKEILNKREKTCISKYGVDHVMKVNEIKNKITKSSLIQQRKNLIQLGIKDTNIISISPLNILCYSCNDNYSLNYKALRQRLIGGCVNPCTNCIPMNSKTSLQEIELLGFIKENYHEVIIENDRKVLEGKELDIYLPELNLAFEFNGVYWHSEEFLEKNYHLNKTNKCLDLNIHLIHVYEDDWNYKKDIVKSRILNLLGKSKRIYARKCVIKEVDSKIARKFLIDNHIQGFVGSKIKLGLYYEDELISLMTFGGLRRNLGQIQKEGNFELLRFCNKLNTTVIGGASRLFKHFTKVYNPIEVISYADRSWSKGGLYENLGFEKIKNTSPNYYYIVDGIRENRFNYRKDILVKEGFDINMTEYDIMLSRNIYRLYDSGSIKFKY